MWTSSYWLPQSYEPLKTLRLIVMDDTHTDDSDGDCVVARHPRGHGQPAFTRRPQPCPSPARQHTCCRTLNSMYGYCSGVVDEYSKKKSGRLQHGL